jgi:hypothetical protein
VGPASGVVAQENQRPGDASWNVPKAMWAPQQQLALWASPYEAHAGDTVQVRVHATRGPVSISVYRLGWYGGIGGRLLVSQPNLAAHPQPACSAPYPGPVTCAWSVTTRFPIAGDWVGGLYLIKATDATGESGFYPFVLSDTRSAAFTAIFPVFTWQAYNRYGGSSLYTQQPGAPPGTLGHFVSFQRPYISAGGGGEVLDDFESLDLRVVRFLERNGYDVDYATDVDLTGMRGPAPHPSHGLIFVAHDEYWTWAEFDTVTALRDHHTHLAFLSANNAYWNIRVSTDANTITCYKLTPDPAAPTPEQTTTNFRLPPLNRPENQLYGIMYNHHLTADTVMQPIIVQDTIGGSNAVAFDGIAGIAPGDAIPNEVAIEGDEIVNNGHTPTNLQVLFATPALPPSSDEGEPELRSNSHFRYYTTFFVVPGGAGVFAGGNVEFARGLDTFRDSPAQPRIEALVKSVLAWMLAN